MKFSTLCATYEQLEKTSSHHAMQKLLADLLRKTTATDIRAVCHLTLGEIAPAFSDVNLGMASKMALRAIANAFGLDARKIEDESKQLGDVGLAAEKYANVRTTLTVTTVFETLHDIASASGTGSQEKKVELLSSLFEKSTAIEARYLARIALGQLRLGCAEKTLLDSLAIAFTGDKELRTALEHAYNVLPDIGTIAATLALKGERGIRLIQPRVGTPIQMMLCQRISALDEIEEKAGLPVTIETKYDGERVQAHKNGNSVVLYSRRLENITLQFPELVLAISKLKARDCIIEGEIIALDSRGKILPFQTIMQRRRKHDIAEYAQKIPAILRSFDILYLNGKSLLALEYTKRYDALQKLTRGGKTVTLAENIICDTVACAETFFQRVVKQGSEGIVIKRHDGLYQAGTRGWNWIKWKPEYLPHMRDTFDLVVVGAFYGRGRRGGTFGALLCAVYDAKKDEFLTLCKLGSGFNDALLGTLQGMLKASKTKPARVVVQDVVPDVWIVPEKVVEVACAEVTKSPMHSAGFALRFPRFLRWREKSAEQANTLKEVAKLVK